MLNIFLRQRKLIKFKINMANNHQQFLTFDDAINMDGRREILKTNRDALREKIRQYFNENYPDDIKPKFSMQGSFAMRTLLNPIKTIDGKLEYDMDDGVYFLGNDIEDRLSVEEYHKRVYEAVDGHTNIPAKDNDPCVTVYYADGHHIDLPIYFKLETDLHPQLAHKKDGWVDSDPKEFYHWFNGLDDIIQLRRIVRYLKAWCDYVEYTNPTIKMPSGCIMTILAHKNFTKNERDDIAMKDVLVNMYNSLSLNFKCMRPTFPTDEDLFDNDKWRARKDSFMRELRDFKEDAEHAINTKNPHDACLKWQLHFGNRFCCSSVPDRDEDAKEMNSAGPTLNNSRFA